MRRLVCFAAFLTLLAIGGDPALAVEGDVDFVRSQQGTGVPAARLPHWRHRVLFRCYACHDRVFHMQSGADAVTMDEIRAGRWCGACHNGKIAFGVGLESCGRCHPAR